MVRPRQQQPQPLAPAPADRHPFLKFHTPNEEAVILELMQRSLLDVYYVDWSVFDALEIRADLESYFSTPWRKLLDFHETQFREPTLEFMSSFAFDDSVTTNQVNAVFFRLGGRSYELTRSEFARAVGILEGHYIRSLGNWPDPSDAEIHAWWQTVSSVTYSTSYTKGTAFDDPRHHILLRILTSTIINRKETANNVNIFDLKMLLPLISRQRICPVMALLYCLQRFSSLRHRQGSPLAGGQYVTRLGRKLGAWTREQEQYFTVEGRVRTLSTDSLKQMKLIKKVGGRYQPCQGPNRVTWIRPEDRGDSSQAAAQRGGDGGDVIMEAAHEAQPMEHDEGEIPQGPEVPQYRYGMPQGWQFPDPQQYDPYTAYRFTGEGISSVGIGVDHLETQFQTLHLDHQRERARNTTHQRASEQRMANQNQAIAGLSQYGEEFREFRQQYEVDRDETRTEMRRGFRRIRRAQQQGFEAIQTELADIRRIHEDDYQRLYDLYQRGSSGAGPSQP